MADNYKKAVLDRLQDAVTLYAEKRHIASLYMAGFVIEVGIKVELERLNAIEITDKENFIKVINYLTNKKVESYSLGSLVELMMEFKGLDEKKSEIFNEKCKVIVNQRLASHNTKKFLQYLNEWKQKIGEKSFNPNWYVISSWSTDLRYGKEIVNCDKPEETTKEGLIKAILFLEKVVFINKKENEKTIKQIGDFKQQLEKLGFDFDNQPNQDTIETEQIDNINNIGE